MIECGEVPTLVNGKVSGVPATTEVGAVATYECDTDYRFKDERNTRTCQSDKTWSNEDLECVKGSYIIPLMSVPAFVKVVAMCLFMQNILLCIFLQLPALIILIWWRMG